MRLVAACLAAASLVAAGGCLGQGGTVTLTFDQQSSVTPAITNFTSSNATAVDQSDGTIHFTATAAQGTLTMNVIGPLHTGDMIDMMVEHNYVSFDRAGSPASGWSNNGGMVAVDAVNPYNLRFLAVPMLRGSGAAMGSFVIDGSGTFK